MWMEIHICDMTSLCVICDPLREKRPFAKIFQNAVGAPTVTLAKKLILNLNNYGQEMESPFLVYILNKFESLKVAVKS